MISVILNHDCPKERELIHRLMIAGNHLASALIGMTSSLKDGLPSYTMDRNEVRELIDDPNIYDAWICYQEIMLVRDLIEYR